VDREEVLELIRSELSIEVKSREVYTGGINGKEGLYSTFHTVQLILEGVVISECDLD